MDGNGRWAKRQGEERIYGHRNAIQAVRDTTEGCAELGVKHLTLYAFSTENWGRPQQEVSGLMELFVHTIRTEIDTLQKNKIRLTSIGDITRMPEQAQIELQEAKDLTAGNKGLNLNLALNYSGRWEITAATKAIATQIANGALNPADITEDTLSAHMGTAQIPDPELLIRTSGELRISNFLLWQLAYTEIYITETLWPDFSKQHLVEAIAAYQKRERRFGKVLS
jgi:undecaprenyl diphosphate synthase